MEDAEFILIAKALADPTRRQILRRIREGREVTCSCVCDSFPLSQPTISHHIKSLEGAGLLNVRRDGQFHVLTVNETKLREFAGQVSPLAPGEKPARPRKSSPRPIR